MDKERKISAIIEARMGSERLPGKVLLPICGKPALGHIINRLKFCKHINEIILATPNTKDNDVLEKFALKNSVACFRGSEDNVLERVYLAAKENNCDVILRITADNPLIDPEIIDLATKNHLEVKADYSCTEYPEKFLPVGLGVEVFNFQALEKAYKNAIKDHEKEHTAIYFIENPHLFKMNSVKLPKSLQNPNLRLTLDTKEDLALITRIYESLYKEGEFFTTEEILKLITINPELKKNNSHIIQKAVKRA